MTETKTLSAMRIPLLDLSRQTATIRAELDEAIARVLDHGQFILGPEVRALEERMAEFCGTRFAIGCASGSDALFLALMALEVKAEDRVVTTPFTFFATAGSIHEVGAVPVFVDIDPVTFNMDPAQLEDALKAGAKAIIPVHLYGQCAEMDAINEIAARQGVPVIEDAAQAIGAEYKGRRAGSLALCGCFSFFPTKNLGAFGDGGMITTDDANLADRLKLLRVHGSRTKYYHETVGINSRLDSLQAAILLVKLNHLDEWTERRRANALAYGELMGTSRVQLALKLPLELQHMKHVYNQFTVRLTDRDRVRLALSEAGIGSEVYYPVPLHLQECFAGLGYGPGDFPHSEAAAREVLSLPIEPGLERADIAAVCERIREFVR
jgi:dTDP-4-amino-4,6-dideoxygalactose transaminase